MTTAVKPLWVTWEKQIRNRSLSRALGAELHELNCAGGRVKRYLTLAIRTIRIVSRSDAKLLFVQNPSLVLALLANIVGRVTGKRVVVDSHNGGLLPLEGQYRTLNLLANFIVRISPFTIVSNAALAEHVRRLGGRPLVLPDPLPDLPVLSVEQESDSVVFICTWATDEPYRNVIDAAQTLASNAKIYITGKPPAAILDTLGAIPDNVALTGYLDDHAFHNLLNRAAVIIDLTTREDCLVCGAYESVALGKPMVLSGTEALRAYFSQGAVFTDNSTSSIADSIASALAQQSELVSQVAALKVELLDSWQQQFADMKQLIAASSAD